MGLKLWAVLSMILLTGCITPGLQCPDVGWDGMTKMDKLSLKLAKEGCFRRNKNNGQICVKKFRRAGIDFYQALCGDPE